MTKNEVTPEQHVALLRHLAGGKSLEVVATILGLTRDQVFDIARNHGYPDESKLSWAADVLAKKQEDEATASLPAGIPTTSRVTIVGSAPAPAAPLTKPDEIRILLNTAKSHPSKRIQTAADKVFDQLDKLRALLRDDQEKHAAKRKADAEKAAARAEVERLEKQLAAAKAKLRGGTTPATAGTADARSEGPSTKGIRTWAHDNGIDCPDRGVLPAHVRQAYDDAHQDGAA